MLEEGNNGVQIDKWLDSRNEMGRGGEMKCGPSHATRNQRATWDASEGLVEHVGSQRRQIARLFVIGTVHDHTHMRRDIRDRRG